MSLINTLQKLTIEIVTGLKSKFYDTVEIDNKIDDINIELEGIRTDLNSKANVETNHSHTQLETLEKINENNGEMTFNTKTLMTKESYDVDNDGIVDKSNMAIKLEGQLITLDELNALSGIRGNIQDLIDALSNGMDFKGEFPTYVNMQEQIPNPQHGYQVIITADENYGGARTQYIYSSSVNNWVYGGGYSSVNNATTDTKGIIQLNGD